MGIGSVNQQISLMGASIDNGDQDLSIRGGATAGAKLYNAMPVSKSTLGSTLWNYKLCVTGWFTAQRDSGNDDDIDAFLEVSLNGSSYVPIRRVRYRLVINETDMLPMFTRAYYQMTTPSVFFRMRGANVGAPSNLNYWSDNYCIDVCVVNVYPL